MSFGSHRLLYDMNERVGARSKKADNPFFVDSVAVVCAGMLALVPINHTHAVNGNAICFYYRLIDKIS
jgi:hypothetical protein